MAGDFIIELGRYTGSDARATLPDGIITVGERAFAGNSLLEEVVLGACPHRAARFCQALGRGVLQQRNVKHDGRCKIGLQRPLLSKVDSR